MWMCEHRFALFICPLSLCTIDCTMNTLADWPLPGSKRLSSTHSDQATISLVTHRGMNLTKTYHYQIIRFVMGFLIVAV